MPTKPIIDNIAPAAKADLGLPMEDDMIADVDVVVGGEDSAMLQALHGCLLAMAPLSSERRQRVVSALLALTPRAKEEW